MLDAPATTVNKSELRNPKVAQRALREPVGIRLGGDQESLVLLSQARFRAHSEVRGLAELFLRMVIELQRDDPSPVVLGDIAYVADWDAPQRHRFVTGFAEALAESLRTDDPVPARGFIELMSHAGQRVTRPDMAGHVSEEGAAALRARLA